MRNSITQRIVKAKACRREVSKSLIQDILVSEVDQSGVTFQPPETARLIHEIFDPEIPVCDSQACTKLTGVSFGPNLRGEMGTLGSLAQKVAPKAVKSFKPQPQLPSKSKSLEGFSLTRSSFCRVGLLTAFSLLNPPLVQVVAMGHRANKNLSFDLRQNKPMESQDHTGSCHAFAMAEVLRHGELGLEIDIARFFVDYWTYRLGPNAEEASRLEVRDQRSLLENLQKKLAGSKNDEEKRKALGEFKYGVNEQGGWSKLDFANFQARGAVLADNDLPKVSFVELSKLTEAIEEVRAKQLANAFLNGIESVSDQAILEEVRPLFERLYAIASESKNHPSRLVVKNKLRGYHVKVISFNKKNMEASVDLFFKTIKKRPAYLAANGHATALVGFDQSRKVFMVRNSWYNTYSELNIDEVFNNLSRYSVIEPADQ